MSLLVSRSREVGFRVLYRSPRELAVEVCSPRDGDVSVMLGSLWRLEDAGWQQVGVDAFLHRSGARASWAGATLTVASSDGRFHVRYASHTGTALVRWVFEALEHATPFLESTGPAPDLHLRLVWDADAIGE